MLTKPNLTKCNKYCVNVGRITMTLNADHYGEVLFFSLLFFFLKIPNNFRCLFPFFVRRFFSFHSHSDKNLWFYLICGDKGDTHPVPGKEQWNHWTILGFFFFGRDANWMNGRVHSFKFIEPPIPRLWFLDIGSKWHYG